jgi:hypothetical protein
MNSTGVQTDVLLSVKEIRMTGQVRTLMAAAVILVPFKANAQAPVTAPMQASLTARIACFSPQRAFAESADGKTTLARLTALQNESPGHRREEQDLTNPGAGARAERRAAK